MTRSTPHGAGRRWRSKRSSGCAQTAGPGVDPGAHERVLERFARGDEGRSRPSGGSGLGLAICRELVEAHSGRVTLEDAPGAGASFTFRLPAAAAAPARSVSASSAGVS